MLGALTHDYLLSLDFHAKYFKDKLISGEDYGSIDEFFKVLFLEVKDGDRPVW